MPNQITTEARNALMLAPFFPLAAAGYYYVNVPAKARPRGDQSTTRARPGPARVVSESFELVDHSRPTQAYNRYPGRSDRVLKGEIWRPANPEKPGPLLVYSHGYMSFRREGYYLARFLASHGYTTVAVDYPLTGARAPDKPLFLDIVNQPGDISLLIDYMLERNDDPEDALHASIAPDKIALGGVSLGALTSMLATFHRDLLDPRVAASVFIAGPTTMLTEKFYATTDVPSLLIYGDGDSFIPFEEHAEPAREMINGATLVTLHDASHAGFAQPASTLMRFMKNPDAFACRMVLRGLGDDAAVNTDYTDLLGGARAGIIEPGHMGPSSTPRVPVAMKAARQQMFTTLASHAFLESIFASSAASRRTARRYLDHVMPRENRGEVTVTT